MLRSLRICQSFLLSFYPFRCFTVFWPRLTKYDSLSKSGQVCYNKRHQKEEQKGQQRKAPNTPTNSNKPSSIYIIQEKPIPKSITKRTMLISAAVLLLRAAGRFFYLCVILDLFSRKVIAYKLSRKNDSRLFGQFGYDSIFFG